MLAMFLYAEKVKTIQKPKKFRTYTKNLLKKQQKE